MKRLFGLAALILAALTFTLASCKTETDDDPTSYTVTIASTITNGSVSANKTSATAGDTVKLTATPADGYALESFSVTDANTNAITVTNGAFTMPASNVTVSATFSKTAETLNKEAADAVIAKITAIGTVAYTAESKAKIDEARAAYNALTDAQKALIPTETLATLTKAETDYNTLKSSAGEATTNQAAADAIIAKINAIGTVVYTAESKAKIDEARAAYDALTDAQKALIPEETLDVLTNAEATYESLITYTVTIASSITNGSVTASPTSAVAGTTITLTATPSNGYQFSAFNVTNASNNAVTVSNNAFTMPASNVTVSASFEALPTFTVTFNADGGSEVASQTVRYGATATKPTDPTKEATATTRYTFAGWYNGDTAFDFATQITANITLTAHWTTQSTDPDTTTYTVTLTGGANATASGGSTTQSGLSGAMTTVTYTANSGYHFAEFTAITNNGITATRTSDSVVTVSGTPTGNASITIPDATEQQATTYSITLTGPYSNFTLVMEYQEGDTWNDMATKYPDYIKIYNKWPGFHTDGLIQDKATGKKVSSTDVIDPNKTYEIH